MASAVALATFVTAAMPAAQAQGELPPMPTPIPFEPGPAQEIKPEPTAAPAETTAPKLPQATEATVWTPASGTLNVNSSGQVTVRVSTSDGDLDPASARFVIFANGSFQTPQTASAAAVGNNATMDLTATGLGSVAVGTQVLFRINLAGGTPVPDSALYTVSNQRSLYLPNALRNQGGPTNPITINSTGVNTCDSINRLFLHPWVRHAVQVPLGDSWFAARNSVAGATIVVSLTNYAPAFAGQLQVWTGGTGATACPGAPSPTFLGLGTNPNPVVTLSNLPAGLVFFRVVSAADQFGNRPVPAPYNISWGYPSGGGVVGAGTEVEPNNNICQATALPERAVYTANDNDQFDFFSIAVPSSGQVMILVENHGTVNTQVQVRAPFRYNNLNEDLADAPNPNCPVRMASGLRKDPYTESVGFVSPAGAQLLTRTGIVIDGGSTGDNAGTANPPQTWFIRVATPNAAGQSGRQYTIRWVLLPPGVTAYPFADKITRTGPLSGNDPLLRVNDPFGGNTREKWFYSFFWANMNQISGGFDTIQFGIDAWDLSGCERNVFPPDPGRTVPSGFANTWTTVSNQASGAMTWKMNKSGAYRIRFRVLRAGQQVFGDEKAIRVDCGFPTFNNGGLWPLSADGATPGSLVVGPDKPAGWVEPIP